jgi:hypothetical protein
MGGAGKMAVVSFTEDENPAAVWVDIIDPDTIHAL